MLATKFQSHEKLDSQIQVKFFKHFILMTFIINLQLAEDSVYNEVYTKA